MTQNLKESFSALMDAQEDDLELRRTLKALQQDYLQAQTWRHYHIISSIIHREKWVDYQTDISAGVLAAIQQEKQVAKVIPKNLPPFSFSFWKSTAAAAVVSLMVITGVQYYQNDKTIINGINYPMISGDSVVGDHQGTASFASFTNNDAVNEKSFQRPQIVPLNYRSVDQSLFQSLRQDKIYKDFANSSIKVFKAKP